MVTSYTMGHPIKYENQAWLYIDSNEPISTKRCCVKCSKPPTPEGFDPCLGYIEGAISACCGHGVEEGFIMYGKTDKDKLK
ncbi:hypothetical protein D3C73_185340 [compost metagenome]